MSKDVLLAIPVYNEEPYVAQVLDAASRYCRDILVVNDGSTDRTREVLDRYRGIRVLTHPDNQGYGKSLGDAFTFAQRHGYGWLITMDCDKQHEPGHIPEFLEMI